SVVVLVVYETNESDVGLTLVSLLYPPAPIGAIPRRVHQRFFDGVGALGVVVPVEPPIELDSRPANIIVSQAIVPLPFFRSLGLHTVGGGQKEVGAHLGRRAVVVDPDGGGVVALRHRGAANQVLALAFYRHFFARRVHCAARYESEPR